MSQASSEFFQRDTAVVVGIKAGENSGDAPGIDIVQSWEGGELVSIEGIVIARDLGEARSALGFDCSTDRLASGFPFFAGKHTVTTGVPLGNPVGMAGLTDLSDGLALFFADPPISVGVELLEEHGKSVSKGAIAGGGTGKFKTQHKAEERKGVEFHDSLGCGNVRFFRG